MALHDYIITTYREVDLYSGVAEAKRWMQEGEAVVVFEEGEFRGILSQGDILRRSHVLVADCLTEKPYPEVSSDVMEILSMMIFNQWDHLPIQKEGTFLGIVSRVSLFSTFLKGGKIFSKGYDRTAELEKLLVVKDKLMLILGHDIKNLFQQVLGTLEILKHQHTDMLPDRIDKLLSLSFESATQINSIFENMLTWAKASQGQLPYHPEYFYAPEVFDTILKQFELAAGKKNVNLRKEIEDDISIYADRQLFVSILLNLVYNAIKFSRPGDTITLKAEKQETMVEVSVGDTGVGMTKEKVKRLFNDQESSQGTLEESGTGLGLILCKEFVEMNQGAIWIESEPGTGTCVKFTVPENQTETIPRLR